MSRPIQYEINDLAVRLEDSGMTGASARVEAARIVNAIAGHYYFKGYHDGQNAGPPAESLEELIERGDD